MWSCERGEMSNIQVCRTCKMQLKLINREEISKNICFLNNFSKALSCVLPLYLLNCWSKHSFHYEIFSWKCWRGAKFILKCVCGLMGIIVAEINFEISAKAAKERERERKQERDVQVLVSDASFLCYVTGWWSRSHCCDRLSRALLLPGKEVNFFSWTLFAL